MELLNRKKQTTIVVTSHDMDDLEEMTQRILLISGGKIKFDGGYEQLRALTGSKCRVRVSSKSNALPKLQGKHISSHSGVHLFEVDIDKTPLPRRLSDLSSLDELLDIELTKLPIEELISNLYIKWSQA